MVSNQNKSSISSFANQFFKRLLNLRIIHIVSITIVAKDFSSKYIKLHIKDIEFHLKVFLEISFDRRYILKV